MAALILGKSWPVGAVTFDRMTFRKMAPYLFEIILLTFILMGCSSECHSVKQHYAEYHMSYSAECHFIGCHSVKYNYPEFYSVSVILSVILPVQFH